MLTKLGGEFVDPYRERSFRMATVTEARAHVRLTIAVASAAFGMYAMLDWALAPPASAWPTWAFMASRLVVLAAGVAALLALPRLRHPESLDRLQVAYQLLFAAAAACVFYGGNLRLSLGEAPPDSAVLNWASLYLMLLVSFVAFLTPFPRAMMVNGAAALLLSVASLAPHGWPTLQALGEVALTGVSCLAGALLLRHQNRVRRGQFAALAALSESEETLRHLFMAVPVPLALTTLSGGSVILANAAALGAFGFSADEAVGQRAERLYTDPQRRRELVEAVRRYGAVSGFEADMTLPDGTVRTFLLSATQVRYEDQDCVIAGATDISERKEIEATLQRLASTDPLTGLANRHHFFSLGVALQARARRFEEPLAVLMMDLDNFKSINDNHGHDVGDLVLITFAELCRQVFRESDMVARIGGEEFAVLLPATDLEGGLNVAERLRERVASHHLVVKGNRPLPFTVSIGVAELEPDEASLDAGLSRADRALYHAKRTGRNCVGCAAPRDQAASA